MVGWIGSYSRFERGAAGTAPHSAALHYAIRFPSAPTNPHTDIRLPPARHTHAHAHTHHTTLPFAHRPHLLLPNHLGSAWFLRPRRWWSSETSGRLVRRAFSYGLCGSMVNSLFILTILSCSVTLYSTFSLLLLFPFLQTWEGHRGVNQWHSLFSVIPVTSVSLMSYYSSLILYIYIFLSLHVSYSSSSL